MSLGGRSIILAGVLVCFPVSLSFAQSDFSLQFPVDCVLGQTCFLQQMVDVDPGPDFQDPVCGLASYDGHTGTDIRTAQIVDLAFAGRVVAAADGVVQATRDGMADRLLDTDSDRAAVGNQGCGNGVLIDHAGGYQTQYCHLARQSIAVDAGQSISAGDYLGAIGLSGLTQFPHLEFIVRKDGEIVDPFTGGGLADGCLSANRSLWADSGLVAAASTASQFIGAGFSVDLAEHSALMHGDPVPLYVGASSVVAWAWVINTAIGDLITLELSGPDGLSFRHTSDPLERRQASFSMSAGQRVEVAPGTYSGVVRLIRDGRTIDSQAFEQRVE